MSSDIQDRGESLFHTPNPEELKQDANKVPSESRHLSDNEADIYEDGRPVDRTQENSDIEPSDANDATLGDRQVIQANIAGQ